MGRETVLFKSEEKKNRTEIGDFFHRLGDKITEGQVILRQGGNDITLDIPTGVTLEIKVEDEEKKHKGIQHSLEIELKWFDNDQDSGGLELG
ncbi:MAG TPA: amphi-Trp domain-containing protein [Thermodesulfobacteriaceae bacterium]|nr:amphi-Trp domain-containing protein [Thermodesulfobacteriaceae bacterium]